MKNDIRNYDKNGNWHGLQITYWSNGNIRWITNYHHGKLNGYEAWFNPDNSINFKSYWNMTKWIYEEDHEWNKQIQINI